MTDDGISTTDAVRQGDSKRRDNRCSHVSRRTDRQFEISDKHAVARLWGISTVALKSHGSRQDYQHQRFRNDCLPPPCRSLSSEDMTAFCGFDIISKMFECESLIVEDGFRREAWHRTLISICQQYPSRDTVLSSFEIV